MFAGLVIDMAEKHKPSIAARVDNRDFTVFTSNKLLWSLTAPHSYDQFHEMFRLTGVEFSRA